MTSTTTFSPSGTSSLDQLLTGQKWSSGALTFAFAASDSTLGYALANSAYFAALTTSEQAAFKSVMAEWSDVANVTFTQVADPSAADITIYWYRDPAGPKAGIVQYPDGTPQGGDIQLGASLTGSDLGQWGSSSQYWAMRAVGAALGLKTPSASVGGFPTASNVYVSNTVMSDFAYAGHSVDQVAEGSYPTAPMLNDIAAIQSLYGANTNALTANTGDTTYTFSPSAAVIFQARYDGGGTDTFNFQSYTTNLSVDLRAGGWTDLGGQYAQLDTGDATKKPPGNIVLPSTGGATLIENAYGGSGNDRLVGNSAANILKPGAGNDTLEGGAGADTFDVSDGATGDKRIIDFAEGDVIKLRDVVVGGAITHNNPNTLTTGQVAIASNGMVNVLHVGLDSTPGADLSFELVNGLEENELAVSGQTIRYVTPDVTAPRVASVAVPTAGAYATGQDLTFTVNFDEAVTVTGTPQLAVTIGSTTRQASYVSGSGSSSLVFSYAIQAGEVDANGVTLGALTLNGGTLKDASGNDASLTLNSVGPTSTVLVDGVSPTVASTSGPSAAIYNVGRALNFTVNFSEAVTVTGTPKLALTLDTGGTVDATYVSGSGSSALVFRYTVQAGNLDADGVTLGSSIALNGGTLKDAAGNAALLTGLSVPSLSSVTVDGVAPVVQSIVPVGPALSNATTQSFTVTFSEAVTGLTSADFDLSKTGTANGTITGISGSGATYTVDVGSVSGNGALQLHLTAGGVVDAAGNLNVSGTGQAITLDNLAPTVNSVLPPADGVYAVGDALDFTVNFNEAVTITGSPHIALVVGAATRYAEYQSGSGGSSVVFRYTIQDGDTDFDGVTVGSLSLNGGTMQDAVGNAASLVLSGLGSTAAVLVDGVAPTITSASGPAAATYKVGDTLNFTVNFSEAVTVTGAPKLALTLDTGGTVDATYVSGSGTSALVFRYTVQTGNADADGVTLGSSIALNGGTLTDAAGNAAPLTGLSVSGLSDVKVNGVGPAAQSIARVGAAVTKAATQAFTVTFSEAVTGVDANDFVLTTTGTASGAITGVTGSGTTYTVSVDSVTGDGTLRLDLNGSGTGIVNGLSNPIGGGFAAGQSFTIDNTAPAAPTIATVAGDDTISASEVSGLTLTGTIEAGAGVALTVGGVAKTAAVSGTTWSYAVTQADIDAWGAGTKTIAVTATDAAGNVGATATHTVTIAAEALTPEPEPEPEPPRPSTLVDVAGRPAAAFVALALDNLGITPASTKTASLTVTLPDGSVAESTAARVQADVNSAIVQFKAGLITQAVFEERLTLAVAPTTGVAHDAYKFFTGATPTHAGMTWLIDSADNPNDLTDGYYARFTAENRYINFAVNLGAVGEGRAGFETQYGGLTFAEAVTKAYGEIIGATEAQSAGFDVAAALRYIQSQEAYFRALGGDDLGAKAAMAGYVLSVGTSFQVGKYYVALEDYVVGAIVGQASAASTAVWDLG
jgi:RsaA N-terminal domain/Peptidase M10 serralysin C terminal/Bacterial Ig-like domain